MDLYQVGYRVSLAFGYTDDSTEQAMGSGVEFAWADSEDEAKAQVLDKLSTSSTAVTWEIVACSKCPDDMLPVFEAIFPRPGSTLTEDEQEDALLAALGIDMDDEDEISTQ